VVADDTDDVDLLANAGLELHHVQAERAVAIHDDDVALRARELRRHGIPGAGTERAERPRVEPVPEPARAEAVRRRAHEVAAVADEDRVAGDEPVDLRAHAQRVDGRLVRRQLWPELLPPLALERTQLLQPGARKGRRPLRGAGTVGERLHD